MVDTPHVEVLYTGGTIGMVETAEGLAPASGFEERARTASQQQGIEGLPAWQLTELMPLIDSANMDQSQWWRLARECVRAREEGACGVVVLHGTDSLAYSAGALAFLLAGLDIPVIISGSMLPVGAQHSDGWENFFGALHTTWARSQAGDSGVYVHFHGDTLDGVSCRKIKSHGRHAFTSAFAASSLMTPSLPSELMAHAPRKEAAVAALPLFPGIQARQLKGMLEGVNGLVLECYGSGTAPSEDDAFFDELETAVQGGVLVVAISQCSEGGVQLGTYAAGSRLIHAGVVSGGRMTREAAMGKLYWLLGSQLDSEQRQQWLKCNIYGELNE